MEITFVNGVNDRLFVYDWPLPFLPTTDIDHLDFRDIAPEFYKENDIVSSEDDGYTLKVDFITYSVLSEGVEIKVFTSRNEN